MEFEQSELDKLIEQRKVLAPGKPENRSALEIIQAWLYDSSGSAPDLSPAHQEIYNRWKGLYQMKLTGKTSAQIMASAPKIFNVKESTIRADLRTLPKVFPAEIDTDMEMIVLHERITRLTRKIEKSKSPKLLPMLPKLYQTLKEINLYFKQDNSLPDPKLFQQNTFIVTADPRALGIDEEIPSIDELREKYKSKALIQDAIIVDGSQ